MKMVKDERTPLQEEGLGRIIDLRLEKLREKDPKFNNVPMDFGKDLFESFHQVRSELKPYNEVHDEVRDEVRMKLHELNPDEITETNEYYDRHRRFLGKLKSSLLFKTIHRDIHSSGEETKKALDYTMEFIEKVLGDLLPPPQPKQQGGQGQGQGQGGTGGEGSGVYGGESGINPAMMDDQLDKRLDAMDKALDVYDDDFLRGLLPEEGEEETKEEEGASGGRGIGNEKGQTKRKVKWLYDNVKKLSSNTNVMEILRLAQKLTLALQGPKQVEWNDITHSSTEFYARPIRDTSEIMRVDPLDLSMPDDIFELQFHKGDLNIRQYIEPDYKRSVMHILLDTSGSMGYNQGKPAIWAASVAVAILYHYSKNGDVGMLRFFSSEAGPLKIATTEKEAIMLARHIMYQGHTGGGTNGQKAIDAAIEDISKQEDELKDAEILFISDGATNIDEHQTKGDLEYNKTKLHYVHIDNGDDKVNQSISKIADNTLTCQMDDNGALQVVGLFSKSGKVPGQERPMDDQWQFYKPLEDSLTEYSEIVGKGPWVCVICKIKYDNECPVCDKCHQPVCPSCSLHATQSPDYCPNCKQQAGWMCKDD